MPRFTLRDVFWCVTLVAVGVAGACIVVASWHELGSIGATAFLIGCGNAIGAGVGALWQKKAVGGIVGGALAILWFTYAWQLLKLIPA